MIKEMSRPNSAQKDKMKVALSLWKSILLAIIFTFAIVTLFGLIVFLFISGAEGMGLSSAGHVAILVVISGVFAWLLKRITDIVSDMSHLWFPEEAEEQDHVKRKT